MATTINFINFVCEQLDGIGNVSYKKMFGEYMIYLNDKPIITVCNNTAFIKKYDCIQEMMKNANVGYPYKNAKEHYILDIDDSCFSKDVITKIEKAIDTSIKK